MSCTRITSSEEGTNIIPNEIVLYVDYRQSGDDTPEEVQRKLEAAIANCHVDGVTAKAELLYFPLTTYTGVEGRGYQGENPFVASADADYIQKVKAAIEDAVGRKIQTKPWPSPPTPATMPSRASSVWAILRQRSSCAIPPGTASTLP